MTYEAPAVRDLGSVQDLTSGSIPFIWADFVVVVGDHGIDNISVNPDADPGIEVVYAS